MDRHNEAVMAYMEALNYDPKNEQIKKAIRESKEQLTGLYNCIPAHKSIASVSAIGFWN